MPMQPLIDAFCEIACSLHRSALRAFLPALRSPLARSREQWGMSLDARPVTDPSEVEQWAASIAAATTVGFDCEFLSQDRLVPQLCLLQLVLERADASPGDAGAAGAASSIVIFDCLAVDVRPIARALAAHPCTVAHAPRQDLQLFAAHFGVELPAVFDLQIAAAFTGLGDQVGYARLVSTVAGVELAKDLQWTDWARRPLSDAQLAYAAADVEYLLPIYRQLVRQLGERTAWVQAESRRVAEIARQAAEVREEDAWEDVAGAAVLPPRSLAYAAALAAWRLRRARQLDLPLGHVLSDKAIVELARRPPRDAQAMRRRVESAAAREHLEELWDVFTGAETAAPPEPPPRRGPPTARAEAWVPGLLLIVELVAGQERIAPRFLATRAEVEALARAFDQRGLEGIAAHPVMNGWRRALVGELCAGWLAGELAIVSEPKPSARSSVRLERRQPVPTAS
jgi:ribonuclease D